MSLRRLDAELQCSRALCHAIRDTVQQLDAVYLLGPEAWSLVLAVPWQYRGTIGLMAWFALRWSELRSLPLQAVARGDRVPIRSTKRGRPRILDAKLARGISAWRSVQLEHPPMIHAYATVCRVVGRARERLDIDIPPQCQRATHLFRHLRAEWMQAQGHTEDDIAYVLGHYSRASTLWYLPATRGLMAKCHQTRRV